MKSRLLSAFTFLLVIALSVAFASDKGSTTKKSTEAKKETHGCCMTGKEAKAKNDCSDKAAMECDPADVAAGKETKKPVEKKPEAKKDGEAK